MKRTREVIKATKANRVAGLVPNEQQVRLSNNAVKRQTKALASKVNPQGFKATKKYACKRKKVNFASHTQTATVSSVCQLR